MLCCGGRCNSGAVCRPDDSVVNNVVFFTLALGAFKDCEDRRTLSNSLTRVKLALVSTMRRYISVEGTFE